MIYDDPKTAPETMLAADGKTVLRRFLVEAAIYAPDKAEAERRLEAAAIYLDTARVDSGVALELQVKIARWLFDEYCEYDNWEAVPQRKRDYYMNQAAALIKNCGLR